MAVLKIERAASSKQRTYPQRFALLTWLLSVAFPLPQATLITVAGIGQHSPPCGKMALEA
jgi:hypothetical protein